MAILLPIAPNGGFGSPVVDVSRPDKSGKRKGLRAQQCPLWVIHGLDGQGRRSYLSVVAPIAAKILQRRECSDVPNADIRNAGRATKKDRLAAVLPKSDQVKAREYAEPNPSIVRC